jgi:hypothetical protein
MHCTVYIIAVLLLERWSTILALLANIIINRNVSKAIYYSFIKSDALLCFTSSPFQLDENCLLVVIAPKW